jgi:hypothetical protein
MERRESATPWMRLRDLPLLILISPFAILLGIHVAGFAMIIRKYCRVPYFVNLTLLYALLLIPAWFIYDSIWILTTGTALVLLASLIPVLIDSREEAMNGSNFEHSAPAHILLVLLYLLVPGIDAVAEARSRLQERQNKAMDTTGSIDAP